jgi:hypothetical protein
MKHSTAFLPLLIAIGTSLVKAQVPSPTTLPVYRIVKSGASAADAAALAKRLDIPAQGLVTAHGKVSFVDANKYLAFPTAAVSESEATRRVLGATRNKNADVPIRLSSIDAHALSEWRVLDEKTALDTISRALDAASLRLESATPLVGHNVLTLYFRDSAGKWLENSKPLDTQVSYKFTVPTGHRLIGPGAQVQVTYDSGGRVSQLHYAARRLEAGPSVKILSEADARERLAHIVPKEARITLRLVYWSPPLEPWIGTRLLHDPRGRSPAERRRLEDSLSSEPDTGHGRPAVRSTLDADRSGERRGGACTCRGDRRQAPLYLHMGWFR